MGAVAYFPEEAATEMELTEDMATNARRFKELVDSGNKKLKTLRQNGKGVTLTNKRLSTVM
jgi:hypothetical protein